MEENRVPEESALVPGRRRKWWVWGLSALAAVVIAVACAAMWAYHALQPPGGDRVRIPLTITKGESVSRIGQSLYDQGLIRSPFMFRLYLAYHHAGGGFQVGHYEIVRGTGIPEIVSQLTRGKVVDETVAVTIPEGYTIEQIGQRLQDKHICTKSAFINAVQHDTFTEPFIQSLPNDPKIKYRLEGYLFPDTYQFKPGDSAHHVVDEMLKDFATRVDSQMMAQIQASGSSLPVIINEASMIEREAKVDSERPLIASVIVNRLRIHMKLQMDCTLQYILGHQEIVTDKDTKVADPYNTYLYTGLPPGPIASPGLASIQAAISPAKTDYLYYVVKNDGTGTDYFAKTYQEQLHNEFLSQQNLKAHSHP